MYRREVTLTNPAIANGFYNSSRSVVCPRPDSINALNMVDNTLRYPSRLDLQLYSRLHPLRNSITPTSNLVTIIANTNICVGATDWPRSYGAVPSNPNVSHQFGNVPEDQYPKNYPKTVSPNVNNCLLGRYDRPNICLI